MKANTFKTIAYLPVSEVLGGADWIMEYLADDPGMPSWGDSDHTLITLGQLKNSVYDVIEYVGDMDEDFRAERKSITDYLDSLDDEIMIDMET